MRVGVCRAVQCQCRLICYQPCYLVFILLYVASVNLTVLSRSTDDVFVIKCGDHICDDRTEYCYPETYECVPCWKLCSRTTRSEVKLCKTRCAKYLELRSTTDATPTNATTVIFAAKSKPIASDGFKILYAFIGIIATIVVLLVFIIVVLLVRKRKQQQNVGSHVEPQPENIPLQEANQDARSEFICASDTDRCDPTCRNQTAADVDNSPI